MYIYIYIDTYIYIYIYIYKPLNLNPLQIPFTRVYARALSVNGFDRVRIVMSDAGAASPLKPLKPVPEDYIISQEIALFSENYINSYKIMYRLRNI